MEQIHNSLSSLPAFQDMDDELNDSMTGLKQVKLSNYGTKKKGGLNGQNSTIQLHITEVTPTGNQEFEGNCSFLNSGVSWNLPFPSY